MNELSPHVPKWGKRTWKNICLDCGNYRNNANDHKRHIYKESSNMNITLEYPWYVAKSRTNKVRLRNLETGAWTPWVKIEKIVLPEIDNVLDFGPHTQSVVPGSTPHVIQDDETTRNEHDTVADVINMPTPEQDARDLDQLNAEEEFMKYTVPELKRLVYSESVRIGQLPMGVGLSKLKKAELIERLILMGVWPDA